MSIQNIGANIAKMRKAKGATQDDLARAVGVSAQAVSKWENGGVPDAELFPAIADFFGVTIDALFGREVSEENLEKALMAKIYDTSEEKKMQTAFDLLWVLEHGFYGKQSDENDTIDKCLQACSWEDQIYSSIQKDYGYTHMGLGNQRKFFFLMPEQEDLAHNLVDGVDFCSLFRDLAEEDVFNAFIFLYKRSASKSFTEQLLVKHIGVTEERASEIIEIMKKYGHIWSQPLELDDRDVTVYRFSPQPYFIGFLVFARDMIHKPECFCYYSGGRSKPYLT